MSATSSNLTADKYGYDMVVATTQGSINSTMKRFLSQYEGQDFICSYGYESDASDKVVPASFQNIDTFFDIKNPTDEELKNLGEQGFAFAFRAKLGISPDVLPSDVPDIIILDQGNSMVTYQLFFAQFDIIELRYARSGMKWINLSQPSAEPYLFRFLVKLDFRTDVTGNAFSELPIEVQQQVKNLNPDSMFSVQQLYLDLNTAGLETLPEIIGLDKSSDAYRLLTSDFINTYWTTISKDGKGVMFGYAVKPQIYNPRQPSIIPTDLNISISPYQNAQGVSMPSQQKLYTLNYLVMTDHRRLPPPVQMGWNWIDDNERRLYHGAMSIRRFTFADMLSQALSPTLVKMCVRPNYSIHVGAATYTIYYGHTMETEPQKYVYKSDKGKEILSFEYSAKSEFEDNGVTYGNITVRFTTKSAVFVEGNTIEIVSTITAWLHLNLLGGVSQGELATYKNTVKYQINVNSMGNLVVTQIDSHFEDLSEDIDVSGWAKLLTFGNINDAIANIKNTLLFFQNVLMGSNAAILNILNSSNVWVFPGGSTFIFKEVYFSDYQDLVTHVTYVDPV